MLICQKAGVHYAYFLYSLCPRECGTRLWRYNDKNKGLIVIWFH